MSTASLSKETVAALRHQLRTPLNHIVGYSEMLLEEGASTERLAQDELARIRESAGRIQDALNSLLPASGPIGDSNVQQLRDALSEPIGEIMRSIGSLASGMPTTCLMDLLRINIAAGELLAFAEGSSIMEPRTPRIRTPAHQRSAAVVRGRLLVVDDNEGNRDMLCRQLERQGHTAEMAEGGKEALRLIAAKPFDLVLLDVLMPEMDGLSVLQAVRSDSRNQNLAVVMISAFDELDQVAGCLQAGAEDYLIKPFEPVLLQARINASLERKRFRDREQDRTRELERANEELQQFAYIASHDLQEPLRTMSVYAQLLTRRWRERMDAESEQFLSFIVDGARRMQTLVADVLALSRVTRAAKPPAQAVNLNDAFQQVLSNLQLAIGESGAVIGRDELPVVMSDFAELTQLLQNLVGNAIKYRRPNVPPDIRVSCAREDGYWKISIADNGVGIHSDHAEDVFLPFHRLHGRDIPGTGIGLAICRRIVERNGGRIWVEPNAPEGCIFRFTIDDLAGGMGS